MIHDDSSADWEFRLVGDGDDRMPLPYGAMRDGAPTLTAILANYLADLRGRARPETVRQAKAALDRLVKGLKLTTLNDVTRARVNEWRQGRIAAGASNRTANHEVSILQAALNHAVRLEQFELNPLAGLRALPTTARFRRRKARALSEPEIERLLSAAEILDRKAGGFPREPLLRALIFTGCRWSELAHVLWADFDMDRQLLTLRAENTKTSEDRVIPLGAGLFNALLRLMSDHLRVRGEQPAATHRIFLTQRGKNWSSDTSNFRRYLHNVMHLAHISYRDSVGSVLHVHAMRHTFVTRLARAGVPVQTAQLLTGHKTLQLVTAVYTHLQVEETRAAILSLPSVTTRGNVSPDSGSKP